MPELNYNILPSPTWNRLRLNGERTEITLSPAPAQPAVQTEALHPIDAEAFAGIETSGGQELSALIAEAAAPLSFAARAGETGVLRATLPGGGAGRLNLLAAEGSCATLVLFVGQGTEDIAAEIRLLAEKNARLRLIQVFDAGESRLFASLGARLAEGASLEVIQLSLSGRLSAFGGRALLEGDGSRLDARIAYRATGDEQIDINWIIPQQGKSTESALRADGVLDGSARKRFRGTIDFLRGSAGSVGAENEDVLLLSPSVGNKTLPIILCAEEDVSGTHGASIGRLSDELLYYFMTRGMDEETARRVMSDARLSSAASAIPDETARREALALLCEEDA